MSPHEGFLSSLINVDLWNQAKWKAMIWISGGGENRTPIVGFVFENHSAGQEIFREWHDRIGTNDAFDELRISVVKDYNQKDGPHYHVHVGAHFESVAKRAEMSGVKVGEETAFFNITRMHKMPTSDNYMAMDSLQAHHGKIGRYLIQPFGYGNGQIIPSDDSLAITKTAILFRRMSDVHSKDDPDHILKSRPS